MTPREAIETIKIAIAEVEWDYPLEYAIAFETAISALENIESLQTRYDLAVAEREANMKAYLEQAKELAAAKAEIERLENSGIRAKSVEDWLAHCNELRAAACKEFAERLRTALSGKIVIRGIHDEEETDLDSTEVWQVIDELVKEMAGEQE